MYSSEDLRDFFKGYKSEAVVKEHRFYSVLIPLVEREGKMHVLLEKRAAHISQPGEICFPGGRIEAGEPPQAAARRANSSAVAVSTDTTSSTTSASKVSGTKLGIRP